MLVKILVLVLIIIAAPVGAYLLKSIWQGSPVILSTIKDSTRLCETQDPRFDYGQACQEFIDKKYPHRSCTFTIKPIEPIPFGSCGTCEISCT